jgi:electron transfer flavoprotein beta subunit
MKILVCMSVVPDTTTKITFTDNDTSFDKSGVQFIINPYDELALTRGLEIAEANSGTVTIVNVGTANNDAVIRKGLAMGAHDAVRIDAEPSDAVMVATEIAALARENGYDLILTGRESIDYNGGTVAPLLAAMLDMPLFNVVTELNVEGGEVSGTRDIDGGKEKLKGSLPAVVSAQKDLCEPRIPNMRGIMQARTKPLEVRPVGGASAPVDYVSYSKPEGRSGVTMIDADNAEELVDLLKDEKKLI